MSKQEELLNDYLRLFLLSNIESEIITSKQKKELELLKLEYGKGQIDVSNFNTPNGNNYLRNDSTYRLVADKVKNYLKYWEMIEITTDERINKEKITVTEKGIKALTNEKFKSELKEKQNENRRSKITYCLNWIILILTITGIAISLCKK